MKELREIAERLEKKADELYNSDSKKDMSKAIGMYESVKQIHIYISELLQKEILTLTK